MKKALAMLLSILLIMAITFPVAAISSIAVKSIQLDKDKITLKVSQTYNLQITLTPANTTQNKLTYVTNNKKVATISSKGQITAIGAGTTVITVLSAENNKILAKCTVSISQNSPITLKMMVMETGGKWNEQHNSPVQQEIKRVTGITLEEVYCEENKYNVILASGDLPDFIRVKNADLGKIITGGNIIELDNLIQTGGKDIIQNISKSISFSKKNWSNGTNKLYYLPVQVGTDAMGIEDTIGPAVRWDYYKELGYPEIKSQDDLLAVLSEMVKKHPKTAENKNVYGVGLWTDWGTFNFVYQTASFLGYQTLGAIGAYKNDTNELTNMATDMKAPMWQSVEYYYKANKLGIFDKESFTMKSADFNAKCTSGQILSGLATWATGDFNKENAKDAKGFMVIPFDWGSHWNGSYAVTGWGDKNLAITKKCKTPERAMEFLNYLYSFDGARTMVNGVKGQHWTIDNGIPKVKAETIKLKAEGGAQFEALGTTADQNLIGLAPSTINPADNKPISLFDTADVLELSLNPLQKEFSEYYKVKYPAEIFAKKIKEGKNKNQSGANTAAVASIPAPPDDIKRLEAVLNDLIMKDFAKCILSKSDAEYEENKVKTLADFKEAGSEKYFAWYQKAWKDALAANK